MVDNVNIFVVSEDDFPNVIPTPGSHQRLQLKDQSGNSILLGFNSLQAASVCWELVTNWILITTAGRTAATGKAMQELKCLKKN